MVEAYYGKLNPSSQYMSRLTHIMNPVTVAGDDHHKYVCDIQFEDAGHFGINIRVTPNHPDPESRHGMGLVIWG